MGACPFCQGEVDEEILTYGGRCPHCLIEIPGEEAPTNPGAEAQAAEAAAEAAAAKKPSAATIGGLLLVGLLAVAGAFTGLQPDEVPMEPIPTGSEAYKKVSGQFLSIDLDDEEEVVEPPPEPRKNPVKSTKKATKKAAKQAPSIGSLVPDTQNLGADDADIQTNQLSAAGGSASPEVPVVPDASQAVADGPTQSAGVLGGTAPRRTSSLNDMGVGGGPNDRLRGVELCGPAIREGAKAVMRNVGKKLSRCADRVLKRDDKFSATVRVSLKVETTGKVAAIDLQPSSPVDAELLECMEKVVGGTTFQPMCEAIDLNKTYKLGR